MGNTKVLQAKDYLVFKLTGVFATDYSDACGTNCLDIIKKTWSQEILNALEINEDLFPTLHASTDIIGHVTDQAAVQTGLLEGTPVVIGAGDGVCAAAGVGVMDKGEAFNYIGSSSWIAMASHQPVFDPEMRTYTWIHVDSNKYSPNGTMQCGGGAVQWMTKLMYKGIKDDYALMNHEAAQSPLGANQLIYLPYLMGERSPRWNPDTKGSFVGLSITHDRGDMARAVMEGVAFNLNIVPQDQFEAAKMDGANSIQNFWYIIVPGVKTVLEVILFLNIVGAIQVFDIPYIMIQGGPGYASSTFTLYTLDTAFKFNDLGMASAMGITMLFLIIILNGAQTKLFNLKGVDKE